MKKLVFISGLFAIMILSGCGSSVRFFHDLEANANFDQYQSYSFLDWTDGNMRSISSLEREQIRINIARVLEDKGFSYQEENADLKIKVSVYFRSARRHRNHYYPYPGISYSSNERALAVDMFEAASKKHIWHSAAIGYIGFADAGQELAAIVSKLFEAYPAKVDINE